MNSKSIGVGAGAIVVVLGLFWWAIGPDWREVLRQRPLSTDIYSYTDGQRDVAFRMGDRVPFFIKKRSIPAGGNVRELPIGDDLKIEMDVDAFLEGQRVAGLVILHNGKVRKETYRLGFGPRQRWISMSMSKSVTSTLLGAAIQDGYISSVDQLITEFIPELKGSGYDGVTIEDALKMASGVEWEERYASPDPDEKRATTTAIEKDENGNDIPLMVSMMKDRPRIHPPGEYYYYSGADTIMLGVLVRRAIDKPLATYLSEKIWKPFGMEDKANWYLNDDGHEQYAGGIMATTKDYARFGLFITEQLKGTGKTVIPQDYLKKATSYQIKTPYDWGYGYQWWVAEPANFPDPVFMADGIFGQSIFIDPKRDLVIAMNSSWPEPLGARNDEWVGRYVFWKAVQAAIDKEDNANS
ncbi:MAG: serine hydrolase domain-containing protein [Pseudomonadota bacterium]